MTALYIIISVLVFGFLIFIHEGGHYLFARLFGVHILEFALGMGPKLVSRSSKKTGITYSLRALPIGGFLSMAGEDEESDDEDAFCNKPVWQRIIITAAGATVNIIAGIIAMAILVGCTQTLQSNVVEAFGTFREDAPVTYRATYEQGLEIGDKIIKIGNTKVYVESDLQYEVAFNGAEPVDVTVIRDGKETVLENVEFSTAEEQGIKMGVIDFFTAPERKTVGSVLKHTLWKCISTVRSVFDSFKGLATGRYGIEAMSGPVGIGTEMVKAAQIDPSTFIYLAILISISLGITNLLPIPALDGGRIFFLLIELIFRKPVSRKVEGYIHFVGIIILFAFMLYITFKDIIKIIP